MEEQAGPTVRVAELKQRKKLSLDRKERGSPHMCSEQKCITKSRLQYAEQRKQGKCSPTQFCLGLRISNSLVVQWLGLRTSTSDLIPDQGSIRDQEVQSKKKKKGPAEKIPSWAFPIQLRNGDQILQILEGHGWVPKQIRDCHQDQNPVLLIPNPSMSSHNMGPM